jgi:hypothetical protein
MQEHENLAELAKICIAQARATRSPEVAEALRRMARDYRQRAARLDGGTVPEIREDRS